MRACRYGALELRGAGGTCVAVYDLRKELLETELDEVCTLIVQM